MMGMIIGCILLGMTLGMGLMLFVSWVTYLRREGKSLWKHVKDLTCCIFSAPEYRHR